MNDYLNFDYAKFAKDVADQLKTGLIPEVKFNKNGYEIRTQLLDIAKDMVQFEYKTKIGQIELQQAQDAKTGQMVHTVSFPEVPGVDKVLEAAEKFNSFINGNGKK
jgi:hypothetical protein